MIEEQIDQVMTIIKKASSIVFFGGAGVSTASGIPDFRGANGLYNYTPEEIISHHFFISHPDKFYEFYWDKMVYPKATPNATHLFLAELEKEKKVTVVTQNIDGLHQEAGSKNVIELHGTTKAYYCMKCHKRYSLKDLVHVGVPTCNECGGIIKPDVVLYEESLDDNNINLAIKAIEQADVLIVGGTSLVVYPAAGLVNYFRGSHLININLGENKLDIPNVISVNCDITKILNTENYHKMT